MKRRVLLVLFLLCSFLLGRSAKAELIDPARPQQFLVGALVELTSGEQVLMLVEARTPHSILIDSPLLGDEGSVAKILWAGELEVIYGDITRINETAGVLERMPLLSEGVYGVPGQGIANLKRYLALYQDIAAKYFSKTKYIDYDPKNKHLNKFLEDIADIRHDISASVGLVCVSLQTIKRLMLKESLSQEVFYGKMSTLVNSVDVLLKDMPKLLPLFSSDFVKTWEGFLPKLEEIAKYDGEALSGKELNEISMVIEGLLRLWQESPNIELLSPNFIAKDKKANNVNKSYTYRKSDAEIIEEVNSLLLGSTRLSEDDAYFRDKLVDIFTYIQIMMRKESESEIWHSNSIRLAIAFLENYTDVLTAVQLELLSSYKALGPSYIELPYEVYDESKFYKNLSSIYNGMDIKGLDIEELTAFTVQKIVDDFNRTGSLDVRGLYAIYNNGQGLLAYFRNKLINSEDVGTRASSAIALKFLLEVVSATPYEIRKEVVVSKLFYDCKVEIDLLVEKEIIKNPELKERLRVCKSKDGKFDTERLIKEIKIKAF